MKVGIFTFPNSVSYGATLQMYALCRAVEQLGYDVEAINYYSSYMRAEMYGNPQSTSVLTHALKRSMKRALHSRLYTHVASFEKKNVPLYPQKSFSDKSLLPSVGERYDAVICGSDQVWNPTITNEDMSYFLDFCAETTRRISYAPSFGVEGLSADFSEAVRKELNQFYALSVREIQGQKMIAEIIGKHVPVVVDPTMLLNREDWRRLEAPYKKIKGEYLLYYTIKNSSVLFKKSRDFAQKHGLTMLVVGGNFFKNILDRDPVVQYAADISPEEWLWLMDHARYVSTNSFHGTAFSIIFEKDFHLELSSATNSRLSNIVNTFGLQHRVISLEKEMDSSRTDYTAANASLQNLREESLQYLKNALYEENEHG